MVKPVLGDLELQQVQSITIDGDQLLVEHGVPALEGDFFQRLNRRATYITLNGVLTGAAVADQIKTLRDKFRAAEPVSFVADIASATQIDQVLIGEMGVRELAGKPERFEYTFTLREFIPPPPPREEPPPPQPDPPDIETATLEVTVEVEGQPNFDFSAITVSLEGIQEGGAALSRTLTNRENNIWTETGLPPGEYTARAAATTPQAMSGMVSATASAGQTTQTSIGLQATSNIATTFVVHFRFDKAFVEPCMRPVLRQVAQYARNHPNEKLVILGHTDKAGTDDYNQSLSERRARAVFGFLTFGVDDSARDAALNDWKAMRESRPAGELPSIKDTWGVREYQHMLQDLGFYPGAVDGDHGPLTDDAVRAYRCHKGLPPGASVDADVWDALIEDYLAQDHLAVTKSQFFPNCSNEILKWLGCGEKDPLDRRETAFRPSRRVEMLFVRANRLPCEPPRPVTFDMPATDAVNSDWCLGSGPAGPGCCIVSPVLKPGKNEPQPCPTDPNGPWCRQPAEPGTITVEGSIQRERPDGALELVPNQAFVLISPKGEFKAGERTNGEATPARTRGGSGADRGAFQFADLPVGAYSLEVITPPNAPVLVRLLEQDDAAIKGNAVCKALRSSSDRLDVVIVNAPVLREIRLPVVAHLMTPLNFTNREIRACPDPTNPANRIAQATTHTDDEIRTFFQGANQIWRQARIRFELTDIVHETYAHPIEDPAVRGNCEVDGDEFKFLLSRSAYPDAVNVFFFKDFVGTGEAGMGISVETGTADGLPGGCAVADQTQIPFGGQLINQVLTPDQSTQVLAHELGHYLNLAHVDAIPANDARLMLPGTLLGANRTLITDEVNQTRAAQGASDDCVPLSLHVTGATQIGGSLSNQFIIVQTPGVTVTVDADIPDRLVAPGEGVLTMTGGSPGANPSQQTVSAATTSETEVVATYTPASGGSIVTARVVIRVVTFTLSMEANGRVIQPINGGTTFVVMRDPSLGAVITVNAEISPAPFCVPTTLVAWSAGAVLPDSLRRTLPQTMVGSTTISATLAGIQKSATVLVLEVTIANVTEVTVGQTVDILVTVNPSPLPQGVSITLELQTRTGEGEARFSSNNSNRMTINRSTTVSVRGVTSSSEENNIRLTATITGHSEMLAQKDITVFCDVFLPAISDSDYTRYVQPPTRGLVQPLINGRSSGGAGPDVDLTEPLSEMERIVKSLGAGDLVYLAAWFFEPATSLVTGAFDGATNWGQLFAKKALAGVKIRIIINDFDPISGMDRWLQDDDLTPLNAIIASLPAAVRDRYKYIVSMHPATVGFFKSLVAGQGGRPINIASHHQKFMIARRGAETFAFCGGLDIESRKTPVRWKYTEVVGGVTRAGLIAWHDLHVMLQGPITQDLEKEFVSRWNREKDNSTRAALPGWVGFETLTTASLSTVDNTAAKRVHRVQMARTISSNAVFSPFTTNRDDVKQTYRKAIACAKRFLYFENQYFRATDIADSVVRQGQANPNLIVIMVVVASAAADDADNAITRHGDHLQFETFDRIVRGLGSSRVRLYTMWHRAVHSKFMMVDDQWMTIGSANANVRSFELDSEINIAIQAPSLVKQFRTRLWAHNLGESEANVATWSVADFFAHWDAVATSNAALRATPAGWENMAGEGVIPFDHTAAPGEEHGSIPDALAKLDLAPDGRLFADRIPADVVSPLVA